jgi:hypothetical protein
MNCPDSSGALQLSLALWHGTGVTVYLGPKALGLYISLYLRESLC